MTFDFDSPSVSLLRQNLGYHHYLADANGEK